MAPGLETTGGNFPNKSFQWVPEIWFLIQLKEIQKNFVLELFRLFPEKPKNAERTILSQIGRLLPTLRRCRRGRRRRRRVVVVGVVVVVVVVIVAHMNVGKWMESFALDTGESKKFVLQKGGWKGCL